jgi:hypothetical protein
MAGETRCPEPGCRRTFDARLNVRWKDLVFHLGMAHNVPAEKREAIARRACGQLHARGAQAVSEERRDD